MDLCWLTDNDNDICNLYKEQHLTRNIRLRRLQWMGHMFKMTDERTPNKAMKG